MRLGVDDTDSLRGMCTTSLVPRLAELAARRGLDLLGYPRLVRLNPNVPWKTRGNGAVALLLGTGEGRPSVIGQAAGGPLVAYPAGEPAPTDEALLEDVCALVDETAHVADPNTNPGVVAVADGEASFGFYRRTVRDLVGLAEVSADLEACAAWSRGWKNGRGRIGALAACGWDARLAGDRTFEVLAYREGSGPRRIDPSTVRDIGARFPSTFDSFDATHGVVRIAPRGPDPVLFGIRGDDAAELVRAQAVVGLERPTSWVVFETNQATDDHIARVPLRDARPLRSVCVEATVASLPRDREGGHVFVDVADDMGHRLTLAAFEPTKGLRVPVRALRPGDVVEAFGGVREVPVEALGHGAPGGPPADAPALELALEKVRVLRVATWRVKVANPVCACGKSMKSRGDGGGFRCVRDGREAAREAASFAVEPRAVAPGWYEACVCARRHLAKPLRRSVARSAPRLAAPTETL